MQENQPNNHLAKAITGQFGGCFLDNKNYLFRHIDGEWVGKPAVQVKMRAGGWRHVWAEEVKANGYELHPLEQEHANKI